MHVTFKLYCTAARRLLPFLAGPGRLRPRTAQAPDGPGPA